MPHLIVLAVAGLGLYAVGKIAQQTARTLAARRAAQARATSPRKGPRDLGTLALDPETGEYRPRT